MKRVKKTQIFVVDDDDCIRESACTIIGNAGYQCTCFTDGESCLAALPDTKCDLLITDVQMPGKDGIELMQAVNKLAPWVPVIIMTSYADVPMSVRALKAGAFDFIEKPFEIKVFMATVKMALQYKDADNPLVGKDLTKTERIVLRLLMQGMCNRRIAFVLQRSERTIEVHRGHIMQKMGVDNIVDLVKRATAMGFVQL